MTDYKVVTPDNLNAEKGFDVNNDDQKINVKIDGSTVAFSESGAIGVSISETEGNQIETKTDGLFVPTPPEVVTADDLVDGTTTKVTDGKIGVDKDALFDVRLTDAFGEDIGRIMSTGIELSESHEDEQ